MLAIHKTFEKGLLGLKQVTLYVHDGSETKKLNQEELKTLYDTLIPGTVVRLTAVNALDATLHEFEVRGARVEFAPWHNTGIDKGLPPEKIVEAYYNVPEGKFRPFVYDESLAQLRVVLQTRNAINQFYGDCVRKIKGAGRNIGIVNESDLTEDLTEAIAYVDILRTQEQFKTPNDKNRLVSYDTRLDQLAAKVPLCVLFNEIAGIKTGYGTAATVACVAGGISRFDNVAKLWKHFGYAVVDGKAPKREHGKQLGFNPEGRTAMWLLGASILRRTSNPWNAYLREQQQMYLARHGKKGYAWNQAFRKLAKEILKRWYLAATGQPFVNQRAVETHCENVLATAAGK